jgi:hypothetical protein
MLRLSSALVLTVPAALAGLALAGCSVAPTTGLTTASTPASTLGVALTPDRALAALPPEAGTVVSVVERRTGDDGLVQTITLAGDPGSRGDDRIEVTRREASGTATSTRVDVETIEAEMAEALPGVAMTVSPRVVTTPTGPVGVATGSAGDGTTCLYAWSNARTRARATPTASFLGLQVASVSNDEMTVRVRLCRRGVGPDRLIALAEGLRLRTDGVLADPSAGGRRVAGSDALASAGYGGSVTDPEVAAPLPAYVPSAPVAPRRVVDRTPPKAAEPKHAAAKPRTVEASARPAPTKPAAETPATVAAPIPLPSGG